MHGKDERDERRSKHSNGWQSRLLSSSVPLEYEVAKILKRKGFHITGEWSYHRISETGQEKEWSVDLRAVAAPAIEIAGVRCPLDVFVECKYRHRGVTWLFLPHPDGDSSFLHSALDGIDHFAPWFIHDHEWNVDLTVCYKGLEIGFGGPIDEDEIEPAKRKITQKALDGQIKHGISQLQFAIPPLIALRIRAAAHSAFEELAPFFVIPILVTNAELVVARRECDREAVSSASAPADLGEVVPALIMSREPGPDFAQHAKRQLAELDFFAKAATLAAVEKYRKDAGSYEIELPSWLAYRIQRDGNDATVISSCSNFLICNVTHFPDMLQDVLRIFLKSANSIRKEPIYKWS